MATDVRLSVWSVRTDEYREPFPDGRRRWVYHIALPGCPITYQGKPYKTHGIARAVARRWATRWLRRGVRLVETSRG